MNFLKSKLDTFVLVLTLSASLIFCNSAGATLNVVATSPDVAWLIQRVGGSQVTVETLLRGTEDPHYADAVPDFIRKVAKADIVCAVGLELEIGWLPKVLSRSGNAKVQTGGTGFCELGSSVSTLERPQGNIDRSMGDVHPMGNPHFWLSPKSLKEASLTVELKLTNLDPNHQAYFKKNRERLDTDLDLLISESKKILAPVVNAPQPPMVIEYHREFIYLLQLYGIKSFGSIEEKPGVPPSAGRIVQIASQAKKAGVRLIIGTDYSPLKTIEKTSEASGIPYWITPISLQPKAGKTDYIELHRQLVRTLAEKLGHK
jgi:zinc/manganese transport system substrate-binding protein